MEFIKANLITDEDLITVDSNTETAINMINPDKIFQYITTGYDDDNTTASITISFGQTISIDRIALLNHNLKDYTLFYNGATANTFSLTGGDTSTSSYSSNSETSQYFVSSSIDCTSVTLDMKKTMQADSDKAVGLFVLSESELEFPRIPSSKNYKIEQASEEITHRLSDGGVRVHTIQGKWNAKIKFKYIERSFVDDLKDIYDQKTSFIFVPFGTTTSWDEVIFDSVWTGDFDFFEFSDDAVNAGYKGSIRLYETS